MNKEFSLHPVSMGFSCLDALVKTSNAVLTRGIEGRHLCIFLDLWERKHSGFYYISYRFFKDTFIRLGELSSIPSLLRVFIITVLNIVNTFIYIYWDAPVAFLVH